MVLDDQNINRWLKVIAPMYDREKLTEFVVLAVPDERGRLPHLKGGLPKRYRTKKYTQTEASSVTVLYHMVHGTSYMVLGFYLPTPAPSANVGNAIFAMQCWRQCCRMTKSDVG